jgi:hypothetical protein
MKPQYISNGWSKSGLYPTNRDRIKQLEQVRNYENSRPNLTGPTKRTYQDLVTTPTTTEQATSLADRLCTTASPRTSIGIQKLLKFGALSTHASTLNEDRIEQVREDVKDQERASKAARVDRRGVGLLYDREGVILAVGAAKGHWKVKWKHRYRNTRREDLILTFKYPPRHDRMVAIVNGASNVVERS